MSRILAALALATTLATGIASANAAPGNAQKDVATMGQITPHGVWDAR